MGCVLACCSTSKILAQLAPPPITNSLSSSFLNLWRFDDTAWLTSRGGYPPLSFTNIDNVAGFDNSALQVDNPDPAWLAYNVVEADNHTNFTCNTGTLLFWFVPNWESNDTNYFGTGPGDWARLIDVGMWTSNATYGWWSLYLNPDGTSITFSGQTNGFGSNYLTYPISWSASWDDDQWHQIALTYSATNSALYIDGRLATSGAGVIFRPNATVLTNGFYIGSDVTGTNQAHGQFDNLRTYNYQLSAAAIYGFYTNPPATGLLPPQNSYPTNTTLLWSMPTEHGLLFGSPSLAPDGSLYVRACLKKKGGCFPRA